MQYSPNAGVNTYRHPTDTGYRSQTIYIPVYYIHLPTPQPKKGNSKINRAILQYLFILKG